MLGVQQLKFIVLVSTELSRFLPLYLEKISSEQTEVQKKKEKGWKWDEKDKKVKSQFKRSNIQIMRNLKRENDGEKNSKEII